MYSKTSRTKHENLISTHTCCNEIIFPYFSSSLFLSLSLPLSPFNSGSALILLFFFFCCVGLLSAVCTTLCVLCSYIINAVVVFACLREYLCAAAADNITPKQRRGATSLGAAMVVV